MRKLLYSVAIQLGVALFMLTSCFSSTRSPPEMFDWENFVISMEEEKRREAGNPRREHKKLQKMTNYDQTDPQNSEICVAPQNLKRTRSIHKHLKSATELSYPSAASANVTERRVCLSKPLISWIIRAPRLSFITLIRPHSLTSEFLREPRTFDSVTIDKISRTYIDVLLMAGTYPEIQKQYCILSARIFAGEIPTLRFAAVPQITLSVELSKNFLDPHYLHLKIIFTIAAEFTLSEDQTYEDILISSAKTVSCLGMTPVTSPQSKVSP